MKNPFMTDDQRILSFGILAGTIVAGTIVYLYLTERGTTAGHQLKKKIKEIAKEKAAAIVSDKTGISKQAIKAVADHLVKYATITVHYYG